MSDLVKGIIPIDWRRYTVPKGITVIQWINDFSMRVRQLITVSQTAGSGGLSALQDIQVCYGNDFKILKRLCFILSSEASKLSSR